MFSLSYNLAVSKGDESKSDDSVSIESFISIINSEKGYPVGLKVLVVDEDVSILEELKPLLQESEFTGTMCSSTSEALSMLRDKSRKFDIIVMAYPLSDMDGFKQIQQFAMEADLPVSYLVPKDTSSLDVKTMNDVLGKDFSKVTKPIRLRSVQCLWFPVVEKRENYIRKLVKAELIDGWDGNMLSTLLYARWGDDGSLQKLVELIQKIVEKEGEDPDVKAEEHDPSIFPNKKAKIEQTKDHMDVKVKDQYASYFLNEKPKIPWRASKLHQDFVMAYYQLGTRNADAAKILERMNSPAGLTRKDVAIHLEEFLFLEKNFPGGHPSKRPSNEVAVPLHSSFPGVPNIWKTLCGSYYD